MKTIDYFEYNWRELLTNASAANSPILNWITSPNSVPSILDKIDDDYLHWSKAKYYAAHAGVTSTELWTFIKYRRSAYREFIPILEEQSFTYSYTPSFQEKIFNIEQLVARINKSMDLGHDELMNHYFIDGLIEEAIATSQFEGAQTKRTVAKEMLQTARSPKNHHEHMIKNAYETSKRLFADPSKMTISTLVNIHNQLIQHTHTDIKADDFDIRTSGVEITDPHNKILFRPTDNGPQIQSSMARLVNFLNDESKGRHFIHPLIKAIVVHFWIAYIHPFYDGNGRTARMLFYWSLSRYEGYELFKYVPISTTLSKRRKDYENSYLFTEHDENDLNYFIHFNLNLILSALVSFEKHLKNTQTKLLKTKDQLNHHKLNLRQLSLVNHAIRHPNSRYTIYSHQESHQITRITATSDLRELVLKGILVESKESKTLIFSVSPRFKSEQRFAD